MNIFLLSRAEVEKTVGKKSVMTPNLLGMNLQGEKAFLITSSSMNEGYDITIGFFNNKARYLVFKKKSSTRWNEADVRVTLMQVGPFSNWSSKPGWTSLIILKRTSTKLLPRQRHGKHPRKNIALSIFP